MSIPAAVYISRSHPPFAIVDPVFPVCCEAFAPLEVSVAPDADVLVDDPLVAFALRALVVLTLVVLTLVALTLVVLVLVVPVLVVLALAVPTRPLLMVVSALQFDDAGAGCGGGVLASPWWKVEPP